MYLKDNIQLMSEWNWEKNQDLNPADYTSGSNKKVWWKCKLGHEWETSISKRALYKTGCPYCAGKKVLAEYNDLASRKPEIAKEWHPSKNQGLHPTDVTVGSNKKVWWLGKCGHEWQEYLSFRALKGTKCPYCSGRRVIKGINDFETWCRTNNEVLLSEWHNVRNGELKPCDVKFGSGKKVWWLGICGHEWQATVDSRRTRGCPYCTGRKVLVGYNDLQSKRPDLAKEWHPSKNDGLKQTDVTAGSDKKVWWKCPNGHEWQAKVSNRSHGQGCPVCDKEFHTSFPEKAICYYMKMLPYEVIENYHGIWLKNMEIDIFLPGVNVGIEYDGQKWHESKQKDINKNEICRDKGIKLIRIREPLCPRIEDDFCVQYILENISDLELEKAIVFILDYLKTQVDNKWDIKIDIAKDRYKIVEMLQMQLKELSLLVVNPSLAREWHPTRNEDIVPEQVFSSSGRKYWWLGICGHEWQAKVSDRNRGNGCPYCSNQKVLLGFNDLASQNPKLASEWHPILNGKLEPKDVIVSSGRAAWWKCRVCGNEWKTRIANRNAGIGCPFCAGQRVIEGVNDLCTVNPEIAKQWDYENNKEVRPENIAANANRKYWWICEKGHHWMACVRDRNKGCGCPICANQKLLVGYNDLATTNPKVASQWHPSKNGDISPNRVLAGSDKKVWWKCSACSYEWEARIANMNFGYGCPKCGRKKQSESAKINRVRKRGSLASNNPHLAQELHPTKNGEFDSNQITAGSNMKVWWKCQKCGHEWEATIHNRNKGRGCPVCGRKRNKL
ncbi:zinc-ribbon domain-containing protein [Anaerobium acetethylicum]|uniref:Probable Zinc-ribbon domain-containing protein n=1 Tax=Anaerobium acetethylicum TaxID=1619234 RepID=A0A1D3TXP4_9FIRM|nr:zinc-ribbon domain-containing protein [Anaerobium acetethylicum]SCP99132.1 Probable Zinc-ribbon domain-containing protein [Anaerobium acetethylicum]